MHIFRKREVITFVLLFISMAFVGGNTTKPKVIPYQEFTTKTKANENCKLFLKNMRRGAILTAMPFRDSRKHDAIFFDAELYNISKNRKIIAYVMSFKMITDEGNVVDGSVYGWEGAFDGDIGENKSYEIYPGTKKVGSIGFSLKKSSKPVKIIYGGTFSIGCSFLTVTSLPLPPIILSPLLKSPI